jgi:hypothetical protein
MDTSPRYTSVEQAVPAAAHMESVAAVLPV